MSCVLIGCGPLFLNKSASINSFIHVTFLTCYSKNSFFLLAEVISMTVQDINLILAQRKRNCIIVASQAVLYAYCTVHLFWTGLKTEKKLPRPLCPDSVQNRPLKDGTSVKPSGCSPQMCGQLPWPAKRGDRNLRIENVFVTKRMWIWRHWQ